MVFSSIEFLFYFLPLSVACYLLAPKRLQNAVLLLASLIFYTWGGGALVLVLLASIGGNYLFSQMISSSRAESSESFKRSAVVLAVAFNVLILGYYKYANFIVEQVNVVGYFAGLGGFAWEAVILPIGISFYTFQSMSYIFDVSRGVSKPLRNPVDFALYISMFPQLIAGPIVRYHIVARRIVNRRTTLDDVAAGGLRFCLGLFKKVVVADAVGEIAETAFALDGAAVGAGTAWIGILAYTLQIYFDFSAYSDMAIGLGQIFGFRFPENFNRPYSAVTVTDFWRRWHMTLSNWFRDYLYIPVGGSRGSPARTYFNLTLVFLITGAWHGANWTFIAWGAYHGLLLVAERLLGSREPSRVQAWIPRRILTLFLVMMGWVVFRADDLGHAGVFYQALFSFSDWTLPLELYDVLSNRNLATLMLASLVFLLPGDFSGWRLVQRNTRPVGYVARYGLVVVGFPYALLLVVSGTFSAFIYFQF